MSSGAGTEREGKAVVAAMLSVTGEQGLAGASVNAQAVLEERNAFGRVGSGYGTLSHAESHALCSLAVRFVTVTVAFTRCRKVGRDSACALSGGVETSTLLVAQCAVCAFLVSTVMESMRVSGPGWW